MERRGGSAQGRVVAGLRGQRQGRRPGSSWKMPAACCRCSTHRRPPSSRSSSRRWKSGPKRPGACSLRMRTSYTSGPSGPPQHRLDRLLPASAKGHGLPGGYGVGRHSRPWHPAAERPRTDGRNPSRTFRARRRSGHQADGTGLPAAAARLTTYEPGGASVPWGEYATGVIRRHPAATADNRRRLFALPGPRATQQGHPGVTSVPWDEYATGVIRRYPAATADSRKRLFAPPGPRATLEGHPGGAPFRRANNATGVIRRHPPQRRITASGYSPYQAHVPCRRPPGLRSVGRITPPALSAEIPPRRRITASGYSPYQAHVPHWKATLGGSVPWGEYATGVIRRDPATTADNRSYSPYRSVPCHAERPPEGGLSAWRPTPRALSAAYLRCFFIATRRRSIPITTGSWSEARYGSALYRLSCCRGVLNSTL